MRVLFAIVLFFLNMKVFSQYNPGYMGRHTAIGVNVQFSPYFPTKIYPIYNFTIEHSINPTVAIEASAGYFKNSFNPFDYFGSDYNLSFVEPTNTSFIGDNYSVQGIKGTVDFSGTNFRVGYVKYLSKHGAMAPYGRRLTLGYFHTNSTIIASNHTYELYKNNWNGSPETLQYTTGENDIYTSKNTSGIYAEIGEKRISKSFLFFEYSLQINVPISSNYPRHIEYGRYTNHQDLFENLMQRNMFLNTLVCLHFGTGILIK